MKTKTYTAIYAEDVCCHSMHSFEATHDGEAIAIALAHSWDDLVSDPDWDSAANPRIVVIEDGCRLVASDIPLNIDEVERANTRRRAAANGLYDALILACTELAHLPRRQQRDSPLGQCRPGQGRGRVAMNTIHHGDCIAIMRAMGAGSVGSILTDPPYVCRYRDRTGRLVLGDDNTDWLMPAFAQMYRVLEDRAFCVSFYRWHQADAFMAAWKAAGFRIAGHIVFRKRYASSTRFLGHRHEQAYLLAKGAVSPPADPPPDVIDWEYTGNRLHPTAETRLGSAASHRRLLPRWFHGARPVLRIRIHARRRARRRTSSASSLTTRITEPLPGVSSTGLQRKAAPPDRSRCPRHSATHARRRRSHAHPGSPPTCPPRQDVQPRTLRNRGRFPVSHVLPRDRSAELALS
jgi:hypothetical protein